jgi:hypothetical protein
LKHNYTFLQGNKSVSCSLPTINSRWTLQFLKLKSKVSEIENLIWSFCGYAESHPQPDFLAYIHGIWDGGSVHLFGELDP